jgi:hypothetical protein
LLDRSVGPLSTHWVAAAELAARFQDQGARALDRCGERRADACRAAASDDDIVGGVWS